jgi:hypothetical protein
MGIFSDIIGKIFHHAKAPAPAPAQAQAAPAPAAAPVPVPDTPTPLAEVDVVGVLDGLNTGQNLNWRTSIVDLMKLLGLDSSLEHRKALAHELGYGGDTSDSASMNIWLHKQVMTKLAENGGKIPADLTA